MRDTDQDWAIIGDTEPFFGVLSAPQYLKSNLSEASLDEFWKSGDQDIDFLLGKIKKHFGEFRHRTALDFGCGVGRLTRALGKQADIATGVDISPGMLEQARKNAPANTRFLTAIPDEIFDLVISLIVFQHIPAQKGYGIFADLLGHIAPGGAFAIQVTLYKDQPFLNRMLEPITRATWDGETVKIFEDVPWPAGTMLMHDYDLTRLFSIAQRSGFVELHMIHTNHGECHGVIMMGRKPG